MHFRNSQKYLATLSLIGAGLLFSLQSEPIQSVKANIDRDKAEIQISSGNDRSSESALTFTQLKQLNASDGAGGDTFGRSVAISGDTAVVGAGEHTGSNGSDQGAVYIFERNQGGINNWGEVKKLVASDGSADDIFGQVVAIDGDTIVVGAILDNVGPNIDQGSAYVYERNQGGSGNWGEVKKLVASDGAASDEFGDSVAINTDTIIVGAHLHDGTSVNQGAAYVFERNQGGGQNWGQIIKLTASDGGSNDQFGWGVAISSDTAIISSDEDTIGANSSQGSAYIFERNNGGSENWGLVKKLIAGDGATGDLFGFSICIENDTAVVSAIVDQVGANTSQGSGYIFDRNQGGAENWGLTKKVVASDGRAGDLLGRAVSISGDVVIFGADGVDIGAAMQRGAAYTFERNSGGLNNWGQGQKLLSTGGADSDNFGSYVAISGNTALVGAWLDDIPGGLNEGSAYIFNAASSTAAKVSVSGRIFTPLGIGINNAIVHLTDHNGNTRESRTNSFGYYSFQDLEAGQAYVFSISAKMNQFEPQIITVNNEMTDLNFTANK